jgi:hypothetical protein
MEDSEGIIRIADVDGVPTIVDVEGVSITSYREGYFCKVGVMIKLDKACKL